MTLGTFLVSINTSKGNGFGPKNYKAQFICNMISTLTYSVIIMNLPLPRIGAVFRSESLSCLIPKGSMFGTMRKAKDMTRTTRQVLACGLLVLDRTKACSFFSCCNRCLKTI